jgi:hypothetical protein
MANWLCKLLLLLSVLVMPLAMAPAASAAPDHRAGHSAAAMEHCPDEGTTPDSDRGIAACNMACAAALPAVGVTIARGALPRGLPGDVGEPRRLAGLEPESADPPPRSA